MQVPVVRVTPALTGVIALVAALAAALLMWRVLDDPLSVVLAAARWAGAGGR